MSSYIPAELRRLIESSGRCEYCLIDERDTYFGCQVDHVISEKHGGATEFDNLAFACTTCNRFKGSDVGSIASDGTFMRFFHPRIDVWEEHFRIDGGRIVAVSPVGEVTARILRFNAADRVAERQLLQRLGRFPEGR